MTPPAGRSPRVVVLTNILAPYRWPIYERLIGRFDVTVLYSGTERNRTQWRSVGTEASLVRVKRSWGITLSWIRRQGRAAMDTTFLHLNPGFFADLIRLKPDAVITDELGFRTLLGLIYGRLFAKPVWVWWGGTLHTERRVGAGRRLLRRFLMKRVRLWFTYGRSSTEYLITLGAQPGTITELQNCVPETPYLIPLQSAIPVRPKPVLLYVGQFIRRKGVELLVEAAAAVQAQGLDFSLLLVGDGPEKGAIQAQALRLRLRNVHFHAAQPPNRMPAVYRSGDVLVFPTLEDVWGLVVNEALWSGLPALVSIYAGCAGELVPPASTFDPLNQDDFTAKLRQAVTGQLPAPDLGRLKRIDEVSDLIIHEVDVGLRGRH